VVAAEGFELGPVAAEAARNVAGMTGAGRDAIPDLTQDALLWCFTHPGRVERCQDPNKLGWELVRALLAQEREKHPPVGNVNAPGKPAQGHVGRRYRAGVLHRLGGAWVRDWAGTDRDPAGHLVARDTVAGLPDPALLGNYLVFGFTEDELAQAWGVSRSTVHRRLVGAVRALLREPEEEGGDGFAGGAIHDASVCEVPGGEAGDDESGYPVEAGGLDD
jgi:hypothetical protein